MKNSAVIDFLLRAALAVAIPLIFNSCVSVNIGPKAGEHSKGVEYREPIGAYRPLKNTSADGAWYNQSNGDSISYFSTCNDPADPTLESVAGDLFSGLTELKTLNQSQPTFNGRDALKMEVQGRIDGVPTQIAALVFKKNGCTYTLSHVGVSKTFANDQKTFEEFLRSFKAP